MNKTRITQSQLDNIEEMLFDIRESIENIEEVLRPSVADEGNKYIDKSKLFPVFDEERWFDR